MVGKAVASGAMGRQRPNSRPSSLEGKSSVGRMEWRKEEEEKEEEWRGWSGGGRRRTWPSTGRQEEGAASGGAEPCQPDWWLLTLSARLVVLLAEALSK